MFHKRCFRALVAIAALLGALAFVASEADARIGGGRGFGSRGTRTFSAPPPTTTAPKASPIERSITQPQRPGNVAQAPGQTAQGGLFGNRFGGFGAGLLGMLFGGGLFSGLAGGGFASFLGLLLQVALVVIVARLIFSWWQRRQAGAYATAGGPSMRDNLSAQPSHRQAYGGGASVPTSNVVINEADFSTFERKLGEIQAAYAAEDLAKLKTLVTPEMLGYLAEDMSDNTSRGVVNEISDVKLLQGDLAESWQEDGRDYATVAMRYSLVDVIRERASGKIVEGSEAPQEITELWTFLRGRGGDWILSAIQPAA